MTDIWRLYLGNKFTGITLRPDPDWPQMWRVHWADQEPSDMLNLTRAQDTAMRWAGRGGGQDRFRLKWKAPKHRRQPAVVR
jgi:hypothetical protein